MSTANAYRINSALMHGCMKSEALSLQLDMQTYEVTGSASVVVALIRASREND